MAQHTVRHTIVATLVLVGAWSTSLTVTERQPSSARTPVRLSLPLNIGGASFRVGMPRQEAMALIAECCSALGGDSDGIVLVGKNGGGILGSIFFRDGRVSALSREEKQVHGKETSDFMVALYRSVLERNTLVQSANVRLSAFSEEMTNSTNRHLLLTFANGRTLRVKQMTLDNGDVVVDLVEER